MTFASYIIILGAVRKWKFLIADRTTSTITWSGSDKILLRLFKSKCTQTSQHKWQRMVSDWPLNCFKCSEEPPCITLRHSISYSPDKICLRCPDSCDEPKADATLVLTFCPNTQPVEMKVDAMKILLTLTGHTAEVKASLMKTWKFSELNVSSIYYCSKDCHVPGIHLV